MIKNVIREDCCEGPPPTRAPTMGPLISARLLGHTPRTVGKEKERQANRCGHLKYTTFEIHAGSYWRFLKLVCVCVCCVHVGLLSWDRVSHWMGSSPFWLDWVANELLGSPCLCLLKLGLQACVATPDFLLHRCRGFRLRFSWLYSQQFYPMSISPALLNSIFTKKKNYVISFYTCLFWGYRKETKQHQALIYMVSHPKTCTYIT